MVWVNLFKPTEHRGTWLVYAVRAMSRSVLDNDGDGPFDRREFPADLQEDAEAYAAHLAKVHSAIRICRD